MPRKNNNMERASRQRVNPYLASTGLEPSLSISDTRGRQASASWPQSSRSSTPGSRTRSSIGPVTKRRFIKNTTKTLQTKAKWKMPKLLNEVLTWWKAPLISRPSLKYKFTQKSFKIWEDFSPSSPSFELHWCWSGWCRISGPTKSLGRSLLWCFWRSAPCRGRRRWPSARTSGPTLTRPSRGRCL